MPVITYISADGAINDIEVESGSSVMQGAVDNNVGVPAVARHVIVTWMLHGRTRYLLPVKWKKICLSVFLNRSQTAA
jgi:hypothetical protein